LPWDGLDAWYDLGELRRGEANLVPGCQASSSHPGKLPVVTGMHLCFAHLKEHVIPAMLPDSLPIPPQQGAGSHRDKDVVSLQQVDTTGGARHLGWLIWVADPPPAEKDSHQQRGHFGARRWLWLFSAA